MNKKPILTLTKKDFIVEYYCGSGKGGQHKNRRKTAVRIKHPASGMEACCEDERKRGQNQKKAFKKLVERIKPWLRIESARKLFQEKDIELKVDEMMKDKNLKIEVKEDSKWKEINNDG